MTIQLIEEDITKSDCKYICHQCNCLTSSSAGVARAIFTTFPWADIYSQRKNNPVDYRNIPKDQTPGNIIIRGDGINQRFVVNMMAQVFPGKPKFGESKFDGFAAREKYFQQCLNKISEIKDIESIAFPYKIGCNLAGGDWEKYYNMLENFAVNVKTKVVVCSMKGTFYEK